MSTSIDINIEQGATFNLALTLQDDFGNVIDITQYAFTAMMRQNYNRDVVEEFTITLKDVPSGEVVVSLTPTQTAALKGGTYVWDIIGLLPTGDVARIAEGQANVSQGVTDYLMSTATEVTVRAAIVGKTVGDQVSLAGKPASYYLNYENLTNTPTSIFDFGITDGTVGQVLSTDGAGNLSFTSTVPNADLLDGNDSTYYLNYDNMHNVPERLQEFNVVDGTAGQVLTSDGLGNWSFQDIGASNTTVDADTFGGLSASYFLDYNNLTNAPASILDLGVTDGIAGSYLRTNGNGTFSFQPISSMTVGNAADADLLNGLPGPYYLNYNNLTNKPTLTTSFFSLTDINDGVAGQVLTTDGNGNATFQTLAPNATTLNGQSAAYYLDYNNLWNKPTIPTASDDLVWDGPADGYHLVSDGSTGYRWEAPVTDADTLDGKPASYFINYNNLNNTPVIPTTFFSLSDVADVAQDGYVWTTDGNGVATFRPNLLDGQAGSFYLDYNNFINTPNIPSSIFDMADVVGTPGSNGYVLTSDGSNFTFKAPNLDATTFDNKLPDYYLDYSNFTSTPFIPLKFLDLLDMQDGNPGQVLTTNGAGIIRFADPQGGGGAGVAVGDADTLDGLDSTYYLNYNNFTNVPTIPSDVSQLTDTTNLLVHFSGDYNDLTNQPTIPVDLNELTDVNGLLNTDVSELTDVNGLLIHPYVPSDVSELTDTTNLLVHFSGDYNDLINKPTIINTYTTGLTFSPASGDLQQTLNDGTTYTTNLDNRYLRTVNAIQGDVNGNAALSLVGTETGTEAERAAFAATDGVIWVVSNDVDPNNDGKTYIYSSSDSQWHQVVGYDTAAMDARYVNQNVDGIDELGDVDTTTTLANNGDALVWDGTNWVPGTAVMSIDDLTDVDITTTAPLVSQTLRWDGTNFIPADADDTFVDDVIFNKGTGLLRVSRNDSVNFDVDLDGRYAQSVNGVQPDTNGNVAITLVSTEVGTEAERAASTPAGGTVWIVAGDTDSNNDGKTYIWSDSTSQWYQVATQDQAALDARYLNHSDQYVQTVNGASPDAAGNVSVSIATTEVGTDAARLLFVPSEEGTVWIVTGDPDPAKDGKTYIWNTDDTTWYQVSSFDEAAADARYVMRTDSIDALADVDTSTTPPTDGQALVWSATDSNWIPGASVGGASTSISLETETFDATAAQTDFVLAKVPTGDVRLSRNGSTLPEAAYTVDSTTRTVTYVPAGNNNEALDANDVITISYVANYGTSYVPTNVISDNTDVDTSGALADQVLSYDAIGNAWKPADLPEFPQYPQAEFAQLNIPYIASIPAFTTVDALTFTLPTPGTYSVSYSIRGGSPAANSFIIASIDRKADGVLVDNSKMLVAYDSASGTQNVTTTTVFITTTEENEEYVVRANAVGSDCTIHNDANGLSTLSYNKISDLLPVQISPLEAVFDSTSFSGNTPIAPNTTIDYHNFTLPTPGTYEITYSLRAVIGTNAASGWVIGSVKRDSDSFVFEESKALLTYQYSNSLGAIDTTTRSFFIETTSDNESFTLNAEAVNLGAILLNNQAGGCNFTYNKIAGYLPVTKTDTLSNFHVDLNQTVNTGIFVQPGEGYRVNCISSSGPRATVDLYRTESGLYFAKFEDDFNTVSDGRVINATSLNIPINYNSYLKTVNDEIVLNEGDGRNALDYTAFIERLGAATATIIPSMDQIIDVDVSTTAPAVGDLLTYNGSKWVPYTNPAQQPGGLLQMLSYNLWDVAEPIQRKKADGTDYPQGTAATDIYFKLPFTPKSANSTITITIDAEFRISGSGTGDEYTHKTTIFDSTDTTELAGMRFIRHTSSSEAGEMGRSNMLFPLTSVYKNNDTDPKIYVSHIQRTAGDDSVLVWNGIITVTETSR